MAAAKPFDVISEQEFEDLKESGKPVKKVLVHVRTREGLVKSMAFPKSKYGLSTRERLIQEYLDDLEKRRLAFRGLAASPGS